jgi:hypothetical protein
VPGLAWCKGRWPGMLFYPGGRNLCIVGYEGMISRLDLEGAQFDNSQAFHDRK